jgi:hypothetical protein
MLAAYIVCGGGRAVGGHRASVVLHVACGEVSAVAEKKEQASAIIARRSMNDEVSVTKMS